MDKTLRDRFQHLHVETLDERVVLHDARVDERVQETLQDVVYVPPPSVWRIAVERQRNRPGELLEKPSEAAYRHSPVLATLSAYEDAMPDVAVVAVYAWWPGEVELYRAHGAAPAACGDFCTGWAVCADFALYALMTFFVGSFLSRPTVMRSGRLWS